MLHWAAEGTKMDFPWPIMYWRIPNVPDLAVAMAAKLNGIMKGDVVSLKNAA